MGSMENSKSEGENAKQNKTSMTKMSYMSAKALKEAGNQAGEKNNMKSPFEGSGK